MRKEEIEKRLRAMPRPTYDEALPITAHRADIVEAIREHQVLVVAGETGSGKTTQLPKFCLEAGLGESPLLPVEESVARLALADRIREVVGLRYPSDG